MESTEQWPDGLGLPEIAAEDARDNEAGCKTARVALISTAIAIAAAVLIPAKIIVMVYGTAFLLDCIAAVIVAWCPVVRIPRLHWNEAWTGPAILIGLPAIPPAFYTILVEWSDESELFTTETRIVKTAYDALAVVTDVESKTASVAAILLCVLGGRCEDVTGSLARLAELRGLATERFIRRHVYSEIVVDIEPSQADFERTAENGVTSIHSAAE